MKTHDVVMKAYKVVRKGHYSIVAEGKYKRRYLVGKTVEAIPGTLGLFVFGRKDHAIGFAISCEAKILEVEIYNYRVPTKVSPAACMESTLRWFYGEGKMMYGRLPPIGTLCTDKLKVIGVVKSD